MSDLDDFLNSQSAALDAERKRLGEEKQEQARVEAILRAKAIREWENLKHVTADLVRGKKYDNKEFAIQNGYISIKNVGTSFSIGMTVNDVPQGLTIVFGRRPGSYFDDPLINIEQWRVQPVVIGDSIVWNTGLTLTNYSTEEFAPEIIKHLIEYCNQYEAAYGRL